MCVQLRLQLVNFLFEELPKNVVHSVALTTQSLVAFYAFGKQTGICLNVGATTETTAIADGSLTSLHFTRLTTLLYSVHWEEYIRGVSIHFHSELKLKYGHSRVDVFRSLRSVLL